MASAIKGGKARLEQVAQQSKGIVPVSEAVDTVKAAGPRGASKAIVKKKIKVKSKA
jgi:hypothetical protein